MDYLVIQQKLGFCVLINSYNLSNLSDRAEAFKLIETLCINKVPIITHFSDTKVKDDVVAKVM